MKIVKKTLIILISLTFLGLLILFVRTNNKTYFNDDNYEGNTIGNIYNGGMYCQYNNKIYFSNINDKNTLYVINSDLSNPIKLYDNKTAYINVDRDYVYFTKTGDNKGYKHKIILPFNNNGQFRINFNGTNMKSISNKPGAYLFLKGNYLYYHAYDVDNGVLFYRKKIDGSEEKILTKDAIIPAAFSNNQMYYTNSSTNHDINSINLNSFTHNTYLKGSFMYPILQDNLIYYINPEANYSIWVNSTISNEATKLIKARTSTYNISKDGVFLYYQIDDGKNNSINVLNLITLESKKILDGDFKHINITDKYVFFSDFSDKTSYILPANGSSKATIFKPVFITEE